MFITVVDNKGTVYLINKYGILCASYNGQEVVITLKDNKGTQIILDKVEGAKVFSVLEDLL